MFRNYDLICEHSICTDDAHTGDTVCMSCGRIISERNACSDIVTESRRGVLQDGSIIRDICAIHHLSEGIALLAYDFYTRYRRSNRVVHGYIAFAIYRACVEYRCPRSVSEVACMCHINPSDLWKIIRDTWDEHCIQMRPSDFAARVYPQIDDLFSAYTRYIRICAIADSMLLECAASPNLLLAAVLTSYLPEAKSGRRERRRVAVACAIADSTVSRFMRGVDYSQSLARAEARIPSIGSTIERKLEKEKDECIK